MSASAKLRDVVIIALTVAGATFGLYLVRGQSSWRPLGTPPEAPQRIHLATPDRIFVQTASGQIYGYQDEQYSYARGGSPEGHWTTRLAGAEGWEAAECSRNNYVPADRYPPQAIRDSVNCWAPVEQSKIGVIYAILEDGSVWRWSTRLWPETAGQIFLIGLGGLCGLLSGVVLFKLPPAITHLTVS